MIEEKNYQDLVVKSKYHPFDNELAFKFYRNFPNFKEHIIDEKEASELAKRDRLESDDLLAIEVSKLQSLQIQQEKNGKEPDPLPKESELREKIHALKSRGIVQWNEIQFDDFMH